MPENNNETNGKNILVPNDIHEKTAYANVVMSTFSREEFTLDFIQQLPGLPGPTVISRVILTPGTAKRMAGVLAQNTSLYEKHFGPISEGQEEMHVLPIAYNGNGHKS